MDEQTIPVAYDVSKPDPEFDPEMIRQAAEESYPEEEVEPSADKYSADEPRDEAGRWTVGGGSMSLGGVPVLKGRTYTLTSRDPADGRTKTWRVKAVNAPHEVLGDHSVTLRPDGSKGRDADLHLLVRPDGTSLLTRLYSDGWFGEAVSLTASSSGATPAR